MQLNILFTSVGQRGYLISYFRDALKGEGLIHAANSEMNVSGFLPADKVVQTPLIHNDSYIPFLIDYCIKNKIKALISLFDIDLPKLAKHKEDFKKIGVEVIVSEPEVIEICSDKWKLYQFLKQNDYHTKLAFLKLSDLKTSINNREAAFPIIMKPRRGMGSIGVQHVATKEELDTSYKFTLKKIKETYLKYESAIVDDVVLIQEMCNGEEYNLDVINDLKRNYQATIVKRKIRMRCGETDCAVTVDNKKLEKLGERLSKTLEHTGNLDVDLILENSIPYIIDMNARFGGGYPFSHLAGANLPAAMISWIKGIPLAENLLNVEYGVKGLKDIVIKRI